eukprot:2101787-Rhodomonas_salina.3
MALRLLLRCHLHRCLLPDQHVDRGVCGCLLSSGGGDRSGGGVRAWKGCCEAPEEVPSQEGSALHRSKGREQRCYRAQEVEEQRAAAVGVQDRNDNELRPTHRIQHHHQCASVIQSRVTDVIIMRY